MKASKAYYEAILEIIRTGHQLTDEVTVALKDFGVTEPQFNVLRILRGTKGQPLAVGQIQDRMIQRSSNITRIVDKLIKKGYVERKECVTNRRKMDITITSTGLHVLKKLDARLNEHHQPFLENLNEEELITLRNLIRKLRNNE